MGEWLLSRRDVPEGQVDRSQVRSAWTAPSQKSRPVGYGLIRAGERTNSSDWMIGVTKLRKTKLKQLVLYYFSLAFLNLAPFSPELPWVKPKKSA